MILSYNNWKRLVESTDTDSNQIDSYFEWKGIQDSIRANDEYRSLIDLILSKFPGATEAALNITIPNPEDPENPLYLRLPTTSPSSRQPLQPNRLITDALKELGVYSKQGRNDVFNWVLMKPEYADLSEEEFRELIINQILKKHDTSSLSNIKEEIDNLFLLISLNMEGVGAADLHEFSKNLVDSAIVNSSIEKIKSIPIKKILVNRATLSKDLADKAQSLLIDYSKLSEDESRTTINDIINYFKYISQTTGGKDETLAAAGNKSATIVLRHLDQYPEFKKRLVQSLLVD